MPVAPGPNGFVPFIGPRSRYDVVHSQPTWICHKMAAGSKMNGEAPRTVAKTEAETDPTLTGGRVVFDNLTKGGLFTLVYNAKKAIVIEAIENPNNLTIELVSKDGTVTRQKPATLPFIVAAGEVIKASGATNGSQISILIRAHEQKVL